MSSSQPTSHNSHHQHTFSSSTNFLKISETMSNTASPSANDWSPKLDSQLAGQLENILLTEDPFYDKFADDTGIDKERMGTRAACGTRTS
jgi:hypothetical protein